MNLQIPGYEVLHRLGKGGMASVFAARELELDRKVAIKWVTLDSDDDKHTIELLNRLEIEARAMAKLRHPNIVELYRFGRMERADQQACFYVMPMLQGGDLSRWLKPSPDGKVHFLLRELLPALAHAHQVGIVHRDIKPENILFDADRPLLADFGAAFTIGDKRVTQTGFSIGSVGYMSPEQARGFPVTGSSDLYSLAVVAYELLSGSRPHHGADALAIAIAQIESAPAPMPDGLSHWDAFFAHALAAKPDDRFRDAVEMLAALPTPTQLEEVKFLSSSPASAPSDIADSKVRTSQRVPTVARPALARPAFARRTSAWIWASAMALMMLIGAGVWWQQTENARALERQRIASIAAELERLPLAGAWQRMQQLSAETHRSRTPWAQALLKRAQGEMQLTVSEESLSNNFQLLDKTLKLRDEYDLELDPGLNPTLLALHRRTEETLRLSIEQWDRSEFQACSDVANALLQTQMLTPAQSTSLEDLLQRAAKLPKQNDRFDIDVKAASAEASPVQLSMKLIREPSPQQRALALLALPISSQQYQAVLGKESPCLTQVKGLSAANGATVGNSGGNLACFTLARAKALLTQLNADSEWRFELPDQTQWQQYRSEWPTLKGHYALGENCLIQTTTLQPNMAQRTWGGVKKVFGGRGAQAKVLRSCNGQQSFALDGSGIQAASSEQRTVLLLVASRDLQ